ALGATPVRMKWIDAQKALTDRSLGGQETSLAVYVATKAHTLGQKQVTLWGFAADPLIFAVSKRAWEGWSEADRALVRQAAIEAAQRELVLARAASEAASATIGLALRGNGVVLNRLTLEERAAFIQKTKPVFDKWAALIGTDLVVRAQDAYAAQPGR
ncbi:MAG: C4-dicarboxylate ABC transporter, partial [Betaproteobacteria bacterium]